ncbi:MAG TPA: hypothetical protein VN847_00885 [Streptosporangiaceae bacterium]|nr:hypothetical protein [Streptosporangiaceae bacterium]
MKAKFVAVTAATVAIVSVCGVTQASVIRPAVIRAAPIRPAPMRPALIRPAVIRLSPAAVAHAAPARPAGTAHPAAARASSSPAPSASDPALTWLASAGGQAQVTLNDDLSTLAGDLEIEDQSPTEANHLVFEADARAMRAEAAKILSTPALLPAVNRQAYEQMLRDFITVANLLQPGPGYGTTAEDWTAWNTALAASNITVS